MELGELHTETTSVPSRSFCPSVFGQRFNQSGSGAAVYSLSDGQSALNPECFSPFVSFSRTTSNTQVTFGCHLTSNCYTYKAPPSSSFQQSGMSHSASGNLGGHSATKQDRVGLSRANLRCDEVPRMVRELGEYQGHTSPYPYLRIPGHIDVPVTQRVRCIDQRRESHFSADSYQSWRWSSSWSDQVYCPKEQTQCSQIWKSSFTEDTVPRSDTRRVRKKRVPYTKSQLKELEHEYTITKFITKEKRRRIAFSTNLSEKQVTIWFQNRRVKNKKIVSKVTKDFGPYQ